MTKLFHTQKWDFEIGNFYHFRCMNLGIIIQVYMQVAKLKCDGSFSLFSKSRFTKSRFGCICCTISMHYFSIIPYYSPFEYYRPYPHLRYKSKTINHGNACEFLGYFLLVFFLCHYLHFKFLCTMHILLKNSKLAVLFPLKIF